MIKLFLLIFVIFIVSCSSNQYYINVIYNHNIFTLIDSVESKPIDTTEGYYQAYARILTEYYTTSGNVFCILSDTVTPWIGEHNIILDNVNPKWDPALLGSYLAGCIVEEYKNHSVENSAFVGNLFALKTYNKIKKIDQSLRIHFFDNLNRSEFRESFKIKCKNDLDEYMNKQIK